MNKKLTLSLDDSVIERAKQYAKEHGISVSKIVENYLKVITSKKELNLSDSKVEEPQAPYENTPLVKKMRGMLDESKFTGNERYEYLKEKYL